MLRLAHIIIFLLLILSFQISSSQVLFTDGFETGNFSAGWTQEYNTPATDWQVQSGGYTYTSGGFIYPKTPPVAFDGEYNAAFKGETTSKTILVSPSIDMSQIDKVFQLSFAYYQACNYNQYLNVYYKETLSGSWNLLISLEENTSEWTEVNLSVPILHSDVYFGFEASWDGGCGICIDDVKVEAFSTYNAQFEVVDQDNNPIPGASVKFRELRTNTDENGLAVFNNMNEGSNIPVVVTRQGYRPQSFTVELNSDITQTVILEPSATFYVKESAQGDNTGINWTDAFVTFQAAIDASLPGDQIWVAQGKYLPTKIWGATEQEASFELKNDVTIYCGFEGNPGDEGNFSLRDIQLYKSVFSGDIDNNDNYDSNGLSQTIVGSNAYIIFRNNNNNILNTAIINGAYISGGISTVGSAIYCKNTNPIFIDCTIKGNFSLQGAVYSEGGNTFFVKCIFEENTGGSVYANQSPAYFDKCKFINNPEFGINIKSSTITLDSAYFYNNHTGIKNETSYVNINSSIFYNNTNNDILNEFSSRCNISKSRFSNCQAISIANNSSSLNVNESFFIDNQKSAIVSNDLLQSSNVDIYETVFTNNGDYSNSGSAIYSKKLSSLNITSSSFYNNNSLSGGAIYLENINTFSIINTEFANNLSTSQGGTIFLDGSIGSIKHCSFGANIGLDANSLFSNNSTIEIRNSIMWDETDQTQIAGNSSTITASYSIVKGGYEDGTNILNQNPLFVDAGSNALRLKGNSPALDAGLEIGITSDIRDSLRPQNDAPDMGAYERPLGIEIIRSFPMDNQKIVGQIQDMYFVFNENIILKTGNINIYLMNDSSLVESVDITSINMLNDSIWFSLSSPLDYGEYFITITPYAFEGAISSYPYIGIVHSVDLNFTVYRPEIYVKHNATGSNTGFSWNDAFLILQDAIDVAVSGQSIWIAQGTYFPTQRRDMADERSKSFTLKNGVKIYGGFEGLSGTEGDFSVRNYENYKVILSADLLQNDTGRDGSVQTDVASMSDNAYHVFYHFANTEIPTTILDTTTTIDGVIISGANANGNNLDAFGGGIFLANSSLKLENCTFANNNSGIAIPSNNISNNPLAASSIFIGNEIANTLPSIIYNCTFIFNKTNSIAYIKGELEISKTNFTQNTDLLYFESSTANISQSYFNNNNGANLINLVVNNNLYFENILVSTNQGTNFINNQSSSNINILSSTIANNTFYRSINNAGNVFMRNTILWDESSAQIYTTGTEDIAYCIIKNGYENGTNIIIEDPLFVDIANNNYSLLSCSPAINSGDNNYIVPIDIIETIRPQDAIIDIGAYEFSDCINYNFINPDYIYWTACVSRDWHNPSNWNTNTVPTSTDRVYIPASTTQCGNPLISATANCKDITIEAQQGAKVEIDYDQGGELIIDL